MKSTRKQRLPTQELGKEMCCNIKTQWPLPLSNLLEGGKYLGFQTVSHIPPPISVEVEVSVWRAWAQRGTGVSAPMMTTQGEIILP